MNDCFYRYKDIIIDLREVEAIRYTRQINHEAIMKITNNEMVIYVHIKGKIIDLETNKVSGRNLFEELNQKWQQIKGD